MVANICKRACSSYNKFKQECSGNDYTYGWLYDPDVDARQLPYENVSYNSKKSLICFESEIEKMSFLSLLKMEGKDIREYAYLSTGSATKYQTIIDVATRIGYQKVIIGYNNDIRTEEEIKQGKINTGKFFSEKASEKLQQLGIESKSIYPENANDWNDLLKSKQKERTFSISNQKKAAQRMYENKYKDKKELNPKALER